MAVRYAVSDNLLRQELWKWSLQRPERISCGLVRIKGQRRETYLAIKSKRVFTTENEVFTKSWEGQKKPALDGVLGEFQECPDETHLSRKPLSPGQSGRQ